MQIMANHAGIFHVHSGRPYSSWQKENIRSNSGKKVLSTCSSFKTQDFGEAYYKSWCGMITKTDLLIQMIRFSTKV